jgi:hypothetical protein
MSTSTRSLRPTLEAIPHGDPSSAATIHAEDAAVSGAAEARPYRPDGQRDRTVTVLPDVVQLPWDPYYLEPPD